MESLRTNGNTMEFWEANSQGLTQPRMKEEAGRLQRSLRNLKLRYPDNFTEITTVQIDYAKNMVGVRFGLQISKRP